MIRVHHAPEALMFSLALANDEILRTKAAEGLASYHCVAEVSTADDNEAYRLTNSIESSWWTNEGVKFLGSAEHGLKGARSSSVGDVFEHENGEHVIVGRFGFVKLP